MVCRHMARPLRGWAGLASQGTTGRTGRPHYSTPPSATLHRLSESGASRARTAGPWDRSCPRSGRSRGGPTSRSRDVDMLMVTWGLCSCAQVTAPRLAMSDR